MKKFFLISASVFLVFISACGNDSSKINPKINSPITGNNSEGTLTGEARENLEKQLKERDEKEHPSFKAINNNDITVCNDVADQKSKFECIFSTAVNLGIKNKNAELCDRVKDLSQRENCTNNVYMNLASLEKNKVYCDKVSSVLVKECLKLTK